MFAYRHEKTSFGRKAVTRAIPASSDLRFFVLSTLGATAFILTLIA